MKTIEEIQKIYDNLLMAIVYADRGQITCGEVKKYALPIQELIDNYSKLEKANELEKLLLSDVYKELEDKYKCLHNEFCLRCGNYKESHKGKCDGCRWKED